jgi:hypothetical protein
MADFDPDVVKSLRRFFEMEAKKIKEKNAFVSKSPGEVDELVDGYDEQIRIWARKIKDELDGLLRYPPWHQHLSDMLEEFHQTGRYDKSVFIMTKFPDGKTKLDGELQQVISAVQRGVTVCGFTPRIASQKAYFPELFKNVELYLLGSRQGVAIVEDVYKPELNPNVAVEWGWMRGMGKRVLYLQEQGFKHQRADWAGLIVETFNWNDPDGNIVDAVKKFLGMNVT